MEPACQCFPFEDLVDDMKALVALTHFDDAARILFGLTCKRYFALIKKNTDLDSISRTFSLALGGFGSFSLLEWVETNIDWTIIFSRLIEGAIVGNNKDMLTVLIQGRKTKPLINGSTYAEIQFEYKHLKHVLSDNQICRFMGRSGSLDLIANFFARKYRTFQSSQKNIAMGAIEGGHIDLFKRFFTDILASQVPVEMIGLQVIEIFDLACAQGDIVAMKFIVDSASQKLGFSKAFFLTYTFGLTRIETADRMIKVLEFYSEIGMDLNTQFVIEAAMQCNDEKVMVFLENRLSGNIYSDLLGVDAVAPCVTSAIRMHNFDFVRFIIEKLPAVLEKIRPVIYVFLFNRQGMRNILSRNYKIKNLTDFIDFLEARGIPLPDDILRTCYPNYDAGRMLHTPLRYDVDDFQKLFELLRYFLEKGKVLDFEFFLRNVIPEKPRFADLVSFLDFYRSTKSNERQWNRQKIINALKKVYPTDQVTSCFK